MFNWSFVIRGYSLKNNPNVSTADIKVSVYHKLYYYTPLFDDTNLFDPKLRRGNLDFSHVSVSRVVLLFDFIRFRGVKVISNLCGVAGIAYILGDTLYKLSAACIIESLNIFWESLSLKTSEQFLKCLGIGAFRWLLVSEFPTNSGDLCDSKEILSASIEDSDVCMSGSLDAEVAFWNDSLSSGATPNIEDVGSIDNGAILIVCISLSTLKIAYNYTLI